MFALWIYLHPHSTYKEPCFIRKSIKLGEQLGLLWAREAGIRREHRSDCPLQSWGNTDCHVKDWRNILQKQATNSISGGSSFLLVLWKHVYNSTYDCKRVIALITKSLHLLCTKRIAIQFWPTWGLPDHVPSLTSTCRLGLSKGEFR